MKKIIYTPDAADKLREINSTIYSQYGSKLAKSIVKNITKAIRGIADNENKGPSVEKMFGVHYCSNIEISFHSPGFKFSSNTISPIEIRFK